MRRRTILISSALLAAIVLGGCFNPFDPLVSVQRAQSTPPPAPSSPENVIKLFEWCQNNKSYDRYFEIFTADYRFQFALADSAGKVYVNRPWTRDDEMAYAKNLFIGGSDRPPAKSISLQLDKTLIPQEDDRPGKNPVWHQTIHTTVTLNIVIDHGDGSTETNQIQGYAKFYLVRGDSAAIPTELKAEFPPDQNRWWIDGWDDETVPSAGGNGGNVARPTPGLAIVRPVGRGSAQAIETSWGDLKIRFR